MAIPAPATCQQNLRRTGEAHWKEIVKPESELLSVSFIDFDNIACYLVIFRHVMYPLS